MSFKSGTQQRRRSLKAALLLMVKCQTTGTHAACLTENRSRCAACDAEPQHDDEQVVEDDTHHRAEDHGAECEVGPSRSAQEVVEPHAKRLEDETEADNLNESLSKVPKLIGRADAREDGVDEEPRHHRDNDGDAYKQRGRVPERALNLVFLSLPQLNCRERVAALAGDHRKAHKEGYHGEGEGGYRHARTVGERLSQKDGIDHVVERVEHHAHDGGDGELEEQLSDALGSQAVGAVIGRCRAV